MNKKRRPMGKSQSKKVFRSGTKVKAKNVSAAPMRGGIRL